MKNKLEKLLVWKEEKWDKAYPALMKLISLILACAASASFLQGNMDEAMYGILAAIFGYMVAEK